MNATAWLTCPECEAPCRDRPLPKKGELRCSRCGVRVKADRGIHSLQPAWAFATAGLFMVLLANVQPIMTFDVAGDKQSNHIISGVMELARQGYGPVAVLVCFAGVVAPALHLAAIWYVASACCLRRRWPGVHRVAALVEMHLLLRGTGAFARYAGELSRVLAYAHERLRIESCLTLTP